MSEPFISRIGGVLSADLATPNHERVTRFYAHILCTGERAKWRSDLSNNHGVPVIGVGERTAELEHLPLQWMPHIQVADVAASAETAKQNGGTVLLHGRDNAGRSQFAVIRDPAGAAFGVIPVIHADCLPEAPAVDSGESPGCIAWLDLTIEKADDTRDFYQKVVGWTVREVAMRDAGDPYADFSMLAEDGQDVAGVCHARGVNEAIPPVWLIYLPVGDYQESLRRVPEEGGKVLHTLQGASGDDLFAVIADPVGAVIAIAPG